MASVGVIDWPSLLWLKNPRSLAWRTILFVCPPSNGARLVIGYEDRRSNPNLDAAFSISPIICLLRASAGAGDLGFRSGVAFAALLAFPPVLGGDEGEGEDSVEAAEGAAGVAFLGGMALGVDAVVAGASFAGVAVADAVGASSTTARRSTTGFV